MLTGYIDESYTGEQEPVTFGLNCVYSTYPAWFWIEVGWSQVLARKNAQLLSEGRKPIRGYHSREIDSFTSDFASWDGDERTEFIRQLIAHAIKGNLFQSVGFTANLKEVGAKWPRVKFEGVKRFGYHVMLRLIMMQLEGTIPGQFGPGAHIDLINERCDYDGVLLDAFDSYLQQRPEAKPLFASITPMGWEDCVPLQIADFVAYEAMKEAHRFRPGTKARERRKSLECFSGLETVGACSEEIPTEEILKWKKLVDENDKRRGKS